MGGLHAQIWKASVELMKVARARSPEVVPKRLEFKMGPEALRRESLAWSYEGQARRTWSRVWRGAPQGQLGSSPGRNRSRYSPRKAWPMMTWFNRAWIAR
ncbi:hypothetical protein AG1IA_04879 [Rhizoctonia solani AG-1 IA]|uniref:Uncharacterized protein n=1 Tax=Thanatephorus cucumeris (strain AG1-IA) TaxID=983506 RepID=L8WWD1_THACA|nr:hypothetical protein AG1IA_04879 [Rhizoctonia solani AG-1 IA]